jgi:hypothetical protein
MRSICIVEIHVAVNNVFSVAMEMQEWVPITLLSTY